MQLFRKSEPLTLSFELKLQLLCVDMLLFLLWSVCKENILWVLSVGWTIKATWSYGGYFFYNFLTFYRPSDWLIVKIISVAAVHLTHVCDYKWYLLLVPVGRCVSAAWEHRISTGCYFSLFVSCWLLSSADTDRKQIIVFCQHVVVKEKWSAVWKNSLHKTKHTHVFYVSFKRGAAASLIAKNITV